SVSGGDGNLTWSWDFGDGSPLNSTEGPVFHVYTSGSNTSFTVNLTVTDIDGSSSSDTIVIDVEIDTIPQVSIISNDTDIVSGQEIEFTPSVSGGNGELTWSWDFGDGSPLSSIEGPVSHVFTTSINTSFTVNLTVVDVDGDVNYSSISINVETDEIPQVFIQANTITIISGQEVLFIPNVTGGNGALTWSWNFGDGSSIITTEGIISHVFTSNEGRSFTVNLTVTDVDGDSNSSVVVVFVDVPRTLIPAYLPPLLAIIIPVSIGLIAVVIVLGRKKHWFNKPRPSVL
ncbi:MAG: PKD domain-containing protein, partial [Candidatus Hodarchaeota archaeon]